MTSNGVTKLAAMFCIGMIIGMVAKDEKQAEYTEITNTAMPKMVECNTEEVIKYEIVKIPVYDDIHMVETELNESEKRLIASIVWGEAGTEDMIGKRLVVDVILNRVGKSGFADSVFGVVHQENQFCSPSGYYSEDCMKAVEMEMQQRLDYDILWFRTDHFHPYGSPAYQHGAHYFSWGDNKEEVQDV